MDNQLLSKATLDALMEIAVQVRHRAKGCAEIALFTGPSGTGKTMAAEVVAIELGRELYRVDLSALVTKYIGETEKNLSLAFDAAGRIDAVLFFDEADALFGKRTEVKDAHDRYSIIEVNYLLQKIEQYNGLVILAIDAVSRVDPAFVRRCQSILDFPGTDES